MKWTVTIEVKDKIDGIANLTVADAEQNRSVPSDVLSPFGKQSWTTTNAWKLCIAMRQVSYRKSKMNAKTKGCLYFGLLLFIVWVLCCVLMLTSCQPKGKFPEIQPEWEAKMWMRSHARTTLTKEDARLIGWAISDIKGTLGECYEYLNDSNDPRVLELLNRIEATWNDIDCASDLVYEIYLKEK